MKIKSIQISGFGKLADRSFEFSPGFNLVFGLNEVGKSTLQQALLSLLFGFFDEGRITTNKKAEQDSYRPWDRKASYGGSIIYSLDNSKTFKISRNFYPNTETSIVDLQNGLDISSKFPSADRGRLFIADLHLGINKTVFENTCFIRQAELVALESSATTITETLMSLSTTSLGNTTTVEAIASLETIIRDRIGSERAYTKPLAQATNLLKKLEEERVQILQKRREVFSLFRELNQHDDRLTSLESQKNQILYKQSLADFEETKTKNDSVKNLDSRIAGLARDLETWKKWSEFPVELRDDLLRLYANHVQYLRQYQEKEQLANEALIEIHVIEKAIAAQQKATKEFEDAKLVDIGELSNIRNLKNKLEFAASNFNICQTRLNSALERLHKERECINVDSSLLDQGLTIAYLVELEQKITAARERVNKANIILEKAYAEWARIGMSEDKYLELETIVQEINSGKRLSPKPRKGCRSVLGGIFGKKRQLTDQTPTEMTIYAQINPIYQSYKHSKEDYESSFAELNALKTEIRTVFRNQIEDGNEIMSIQSIRLKLEKELEIQGSIKQQEKSLSTLEDELNQANDHYKLVKGELSKIIADLGFDTKDLITAINDYEGLCERKSKLEKFEAELEKLVTQKNIHKFVIKSFDTAKKDLQLIDTDLRKILLLAGISTEEDSIENAVHEFDVRKNNHDKWEMAKTNYDHALQQRESLLERVDPEVVQKKLKDLKVNMDGILTAHPEYRNFQTEKSYRDYEGDLNQIGKIKEKLQKEQLRLSDTIQRVSNNFRSLAEVDEQIHLVKERINYLEKIKAEVELAINLLRNATQEYQKEFAPRIERLISLGVSQITENRYSSVIVNPENLNVSMVAPEIGKVVSVENLSAGTRDLVFLTLRLAIAQYMSRTGEKLPMLLDDPFVQLDQGRLRNAMGYLQQLSQVTQIIFFTKDEWVKNWLINSLPSKGNLIELQ